MWYPWSSVVLDCIDSRSLPPFLLREDTEHMIPDIKPVVQKNCYWHLVFDDDISKAVAE